MFSGEVVNKGHFQVNIGPIRFIFIIKDFYNLKLTPIFNFCLESKFIWRVNLTKAWVY